MRDPIRLLVVVILVILAVLLVLALAGRADAKDTGSSGLHIALADAGHHVGEVDRKGQTKAEEQEAGASDVFQDFEPQQREALGHLGAAHAPASRSVMRFREPCRSP